MRGGIGFYDQATVTAATGYHDFPGASGDYASSDDVTAPTADGDLELKLWFDPDDETPAVQEYLICQFVPAGGNRAYRWTLNENGRSTVGISANGSTQQSTTSTAAPTTGYVGLRMFYDRSEETIRFFSTAVHLSDSHWTQYGSTATGKTRDLFTTSTADIEIGTYNNGTLQMLNAKVYAAEIAYNGIVVAQPNFTTDTGITDTNGNTWTANGNVDFVAD